MFEYPKAFKNLFVYMQKYLFNIPDSGRLPSSVMTFINKLGTNKQEPGKDIELPVADESWSDMSWHYIVTSFQLPYKPDICYKYNLYFL